jgi:TolA-binding protein
MNRFLSLPLAATVLTVLLTGSVLAQDAAEMQLRIDRLESLVRQQNGLLEQVQNQNRRLEDQVKRMQSDIDFRFKEIEGGRSGAPAARPPAAPATPPTRQQRGDAFNPDAAPGSTGGVQPLGSPQSASAPRNVRPAGPVAQPGQIIQGEENALGRDPRQPTDLASAGRTAPVAPATGPVTPASLRARGREQLQRGEYEAAEATFRELINAKPGGLMPDAMMGLGDSFFQRQRWREAAEQYVDITARFSKAGVAPEAELKLGISLRSLGAVKEACDVLTNHGQKYPKASSAIRQGVQRELQRGKCAA